MVQGSKPKAHMVVSLPPLEGLIANSLMTSILLLAPFGPLCFARSCMTSLIGPPFLVTLLVKLLGNKTMVEFSYIGLVSLKLCQLFQVHSQCHLTLLCLY